MYGKKLFCIRYIYNNMTFYISLRFLLPNLDLRNVKTNKQTVLGKGWGTFVRVHARIVSKF